MPENIVSQLELVIAQRRDDGVSGKKSYVASLMVKGVPKIGEKITEEAQEVIEAALEEGANGREHLIKEAADLFFHMMVLLGYCRIGWSEVENELGRRFGVGGHEEKAARQGPKKPND